MYDAATHHQLAGLRATELQSQTRRAALASLAACCKPSAIRAAAARAWRGTVDWYRSGQLGPGYVRDGCI